MAELGDEPSRTDIERSLDAAGRPVIKLVGELDISNVTTVEAQVDSVVSSSARVSFDLSALTFMDSSGIAMLLRVAEDPVVLLRPSDTIKRIIGATGLTEVFEIVDD